MQESFHYFYMQESCRIYNGEQRGVGVLFLVHMTTRKLLSIFWESWGRYTEVSAGFCYILYITHPVVYAHPWDEYQ